MAKNKSPGAGSPGTLNIQLESISISIASVVFDSCAIKQPLNQVVNPIGFGVLAKATSCLGAWTPRCWKECRVPALKLCVDAIAFARIEVTTAVNLHRLAGYDLPKRPFELRVYIQKQGSHPGTRLSRG